ncbi:MAG TPA: dockerin type I domain-containing protein [Pseudobacteroides sp.]|uniref:dockerin type I domain-containing protein n=1 Tax=Pseudobacteroides sp. TaxID=1968840 RepID=UPI002F94DF5C
MKRMLLVLTLMLAVLIQLPNSTWALENTQEADVTEFKYKAVDAGYKNSVALTENGTVLAWGYNNDSKSNIPVGIKAKAISAGFYHTVVLLEDGTVRVWGGPSFCNVPVGLKGVKAIDTGMEYTLALKEDGTVVSWGSNAYIADIGAYKLPEGLAGIKDIAAGDYHSLALKEDGTILAWGSNNYGECNIPDNIGDVKSIATGDCFTAILSETGKLTVVGRINNKANNISDYTRFNYITAFRGKLVAITNDGTLCEFGGGDTVLGYKERQIYSECTNPIAIAIGYDHCLILEEDGKLVAAGDNSQNQCNIPANYIAVAAGNQHCIALTSRNSVIGYGDPMCFGAYTDGIIPYNKNIRAIYAAYYYCALIDTNDNLKIVGIPHNDVPGSLSNIKAVAATEYYMAVLNNDGTVKVYGEFGYKYKVPEGLNNVAAISASDSHITILKNDGTVIDLLDRIDKKELIHENMGKVKSVSAGLGYTLALKEDGTVVGWDMYNTPLNLPSNWENVKSISTNKVGLLAIAVKEDGTLVGLNSGTYKDIIDSTENVKAVSIYSNKITFLKEDGSILTYGLDYNFAYSYPGLENDIWKIPSQISLMNAAKIGICDLNSDGNINMMDIIRLALSFGAVNSDANYDLNCDFDRDGTINMADVVFIARYFGEKIQ